MAALLLLQGDKGVIKCEKSIKNILTFFSSGASTRVFLLYLSRAVHPRENLRSRRVAGQRRIAAAIFLARTLRFLAAAGGDQRHGSGRCSRCRRRCWVVVGLRARGVGVVFYFVIKVDYHRPVLACSANITAAAANSCIIRVLYQLVSSGD